MSTFSQVLRTRAEEVDNPVLRQYLTVTWWLVLVAPFTMSATLYLSLRYLARSKDYNRGWKFVNAILCVISVIHFAFAWTARGHYCSFVGGDKVFDDGEVYWALKATLFLTATAVLVSQQTLVFMASLAHQGTLQFRLEAHLAAVFAWGYDIYVIFFDAENITRNVSGHYTLAIIHQTATAWVSLVFVTYYLVRAFMCALSNYIAALNSPSEVEIGSPFHRAMNTLWFLTISLFVMFPVSAGTFILHDVNFQLYTFVGTDTPSFAFLIFLDVLQYEFIGNLYPVLVVAALMTYGNAPFFLETEGDGDHGKQ